VKSIQSPHVRPDAGNGGRRSHWPAETCPRGRAGGGPSWAAAIRKSEKYRSL